MAAGEWAFTADVSGPPDGDLVLLLHGFPQTRHAWRAEMRSLAGAGFRACAPDQRGYSPGARPVDIDAYRVELLVADVLAIADALGRERFHLVGHDWGGQLAWVTAAMHPDRVRTLSVISRPHPAAFAAAMRSDPEQSGRSGHHRSFLRPEATDELLADDAARLRSIYVAFRRPPARRRSLSRHSWRVGRAGCRGELVSGCRTLRAAGARHSRRHGADAVCLGGRGPDGRPRRR